MQPTDGESASEALREIDEALEKALERVDDDVRISDGQALGTLHASTN